MLPPMTPEQLLTSETGWMLLATACLGGLVGLVRQWRGTTTAGMRTFALWSVLGFISVQVEQLGIAHFTIATLTLLGISSAAFLIRGKKRIRESDNSSYEASFGLTTAAASLAMFSVGILMGLEQAKYAVMIAIVVAVTISSRSWTDKWSASLTGTDIRAGLQFACLTGILLPLVPDRMLWDAFNPYATWLMVVLITGVNFIGYIAIRWLGARAGAAITGLIGGLASSTAVTLSFSRRSVVEPEDGGAFAVAIMLAQLSMLVRLVVLMLVLCLALGQFMLVPWLVLFAAGLAGCGIVAARHGNKAEGKVPEIKNPLDLGSAIKFAALYAVVVFLIQETGTAAGTGFFAVSFFSGIPDTAAVLMSLSNQAADGQLAFPLASLGILVGVFANTVAKLCIALVVGRGAFRRYVGFGFGAMLAANAALVVWFALKP
ncbi:MAG TPA: MgtC/SapB family protein [Candidatus Spyradosoma merdigallinarum]|uniref:MgtC/SapB family protein n=1 Tax=Candidatus Spyradosoma merdigallinarum TaxID=2840950 RepID=A0A9D1T0X4_9BACT|nr:MgtC/SapB family protein [Candidatus Spyradosoma merdigallinarum]